MPRPKKSAKIGNGKRAVVYLRVSKEDGNTKRGLDVQREVCLLYAEQKEYEVVAIMDQDNGVSGATTLDERVGLRAAFDLCLADKADVIVAYKQDRFARKMGVFEDIRDLATAKSIRLETTDGRVLTHPDDVVVGNALAMVAAIERYSIAMRFLAARRHRSRKDGLGSGIVPLGYRRLPDGGVEIDEPAAKLVRELLKLRESHTYQETANILNERGYTTPRSGKPWTPGHVQGVERNLDLYITGTRVWDGITASQKWPIIYEDGVK
ncbi:MAG: recombinase family protein [Ktedonobacterales bacterium]